MNETELREWMQAAADGARRGGQVLLDGRKRFTVRSKGRNDLVTDADFAAQETIQRFLQERFPAHDFLGEESRRQAPIRRGEPGRPTWVVDPLDGTTNFAHGCPVFAVSIGLELDGELLIGAIFDPCLDELFLSAKGLGAWLGEERLTTSRCDRLADSLLSTGFPPDVAAHTDTLAAWNHFSLRVQSLRRTGSTALNLAYVAAGRFDGFWAQQAWPWDAAAGVVLIREAGGVVTNFDGTAYDLYTQDIVASNGPLHPALVAGLAGMESRS